MFPSLTCLLVDPDPIFTRDLQTALDQTGDIHVIGTVNTCADMLRLSQEYRPDVILISLHLLVSDALHLIEQLHTRSPHSKILLLGNGISKHQILQSLKLQTWGYVSKTATPIPDIIKAIRALNNGGAILDPEIAGWLLDKIRET